MTGSIYFSCVLARKPSNLDKTQETKNGSSRDTPGSVWKHTKALSIAVWDFNK